MVISFKDIDSVSIFLTYQAHVPEKILNFQEHMV